MQPQHLPPQKTAREKFGWRYMLAGFAIILLAGVTYYYAPRSASPELYGRVGNYLMAAGLVMYVVGRVLRWRARRGAQEL
jgi:hypothetical protein